MKEKEMEIIAGLIDEVITNRQDTKIIEKVRKEVEKLTKKFPLYPGL